MKKCSKCGGTKEFKQFPKDTGSKDGLYVFCRDCSRKNGKAWREKLRLNPRQPPEIKKCISCGTMKEKRQFHRSVTYMDGLSSMCKSCIKDKDRLRTHGLTPEEYKGILSRQQNKCAICGSINSKSKAHPDLCVDHDHKTGKVRGLLCVKCNSGLGQFEDSPEALRKAIEYLREYQNAKAITALPPSLPSVGLLEAADCAP